MENLPKFKEKLAHLPKGARLRERERDRKMQDTDRLREMAEAIYDVDGAYAEQLNAAADEADYDGLDMRSLEEGYGDDPDPTWAGHGYSIG